MVLAYAAAMTVWCWQAPESVRRSDGSRPVRLELARRAHLPVSALDVGGLKGQRELTAAMPHASTVASFRNVMVGFMQISDRATTTFTRGRAEVMRHSRHTRPRHFPRFSDPRRLTAHDAVVSGMRPVRPQVVQRGLNHGDHWGRAPRSRQHRAIANLAFDDPRRSLRGAH